jgi:hypothetical protein
LSLWPSHKNNRNSDIEIIGRNLYDRATNLTGKGGILWETKAEKRIRRKVKSRKPAKRPKRRRGEFAEASPSRRSWASLRRCP